MPRIRHYYLHRWYVKHGRKGTIYVHLHGRQFASAHGGAHYSEYHTLHNLPGLSAEELVRCAVAQSKTTWKVSWTANRMQFDSKFYKPLEPHLRSALTGYSSPAEPQDEPGEPAYSQQPYYPPQQTTVPPGLPSYPQQQYPQPYYPPQQPTSKGVGYYLRLLFQKLYR